MPSLYAYLALIASAFTSATLLPGTSEAAYAAFVYQYPQHALGACLCAGLANGLGSMVSYYMGRMFPAKKRPSEKVLARIQRWGILAAIICMVADYRRCPPPCRRLAQAQCLALHYHSDYRQTAALCHDLLGNERSCRISLQVKIKAV